jgi:hypothetical protein
MKETVHGKAAVRTRLAGSSFRFACSPRLAVCPYRFGSPIRGDRADETHSAWTLQLRGLTGATCM